jgi:hypothetical protein
MTFMISMPADFRVGETRDCRINKKPMQVTWRDNNTLVIEPDDAREIVFKERSDNLITFVCADADGSRPHISLPTEGE